MPSDSLEALTTSLGDVDALIADHGIITGGGAGAPEGRKGGELTRGGTVLLAAALEGYIEGVFDEAVDKLYGSQAKSRRKTFKKERGGRSDGASPWHIEMLFSHIGVPWALDGIRWQKFNNESVRDSLKKLSKARNKIAHGAAPKGAQIREVAAWRNVVERTTKQLDKKVAEHIETKTGKRPW